MSDAAPTTAEPADTTSNVDVVTEPPHVQDQSQQPSDMTEPVPPQEVTVAHADPEALKAQIEALKPNTEVADATAPKELDPHFGQGGRFYIDPESGERKRGLPPTEVDTDTAQPQAGQKLAPVEAPPAKS